MTRRKFITLHRRRGGSVAGGGARQQTAMPVIGFLGAQSGEANTDRIRFFRQGLFERDTQRGEMLQSNTGGPRLKQIDCLRWWLTWFVNVSP